MRIRCPRHKELIEPTYKKLWSVWDKREIGWIQVLEIVCPVCEDRVFTAAAKGYDLIIGIMESRGALAERWPDNVPAPFMENELDSIMLEIETELVRAINAEQKTAYGLGFIVWLRKFFQLNGGE